MLTGRQHGNHNICLGRSFVGAFCGGTTGLHDRLQNGSTEIEGLHRVARFDEIARHGSAHVADTDKSNVAHYDSSPPSLSSPLSVGADSHSTTASVELASSEGFHLGA